MTTDKNISDELFIIKKDLAFEIKEREKQSAELAIAKLELTFQNDEKGKRAEELIAINQELAFQIEEKEKLTTELINVNRKLASQNEEKKKRASELIIANRELVFQNEEKEKRAQELVVANVELTFQNKEKERRASELILANDELIFQNKEKEKRAAELAGANSELAFQNREKEKRAAELIVANRELIFQNEEKEKRAAELVIANNELAFQNEEKEKRAAELITANAELVFQNVEKGKLAAELVIANNELAFQNEEKEKRAAELIIINAELEAFSYVSSHDLQEPLRKIQIFSRRISELECQTLSEKGKDYFDRVQLAATRMRVLIDDLLAFSRLSVAERKFETVDLNTIIEDVKGELKETLDEKCLTIEVAKPCNVRIIPFQFRQLMHNLISNALKFSKPDRPPHVTIKSKISRGSELNEKKLLPEINYCHISVSDNGIGFDPQDKDLIFQVFQRLHGRQSYTGSGIGLAIVKKVVDNHNGVINAIGLPNEGATFNIYIPVS